jgi:hypothetical protein
MEKKIMGVVRRAYRESQERVAREANLRAGRTADHQRTVNERAADEVERQARRKAARSSQ